MLGVIIYAHISSAVINSAHTHAEINSRVRILGKYFYRKKGATEKNKWLKKAGETTVEVLVYYGGSEAARQGRLGFLHGSSREEEVFYMIFKCDGECIVI